MSAPPATASRQARRIVGVVAGLAGVAVWAGVLFWWAASFRPPAERGMPSRSPVPATSTDRAEGIPTVQAEGAPGAGLPPIERMAEKLAQRLASSTPDDGQGWLLLGRTYMELGRNADAVRALERARALLGDDEQLMDYYNRAIAMSKR